MLNNPVAKRQGADYSWFGFLDAENMGMGQSVTAVLNLPVELADFRRCVEKESGNIATSSFASGGALHCLQ
jgi:hypothetical protein